MNALTQHNRPIRCRSSVRVLGGSILKIPSMYSGSGRIPCSSMHRPMKLICFLSKWHLLDLSFKLCFANAVKTWRWLSRNTLKSGPTIDKSSRYVKMYARFRLCVASKYNRKCRVEEGDKRRRRQLLLYPVEGFLRRRRPKEWTIFVTLIDRVHQVAEAVEANTLAHFRLDECSNTA